MSVFRRSTTEVAAASDASGTGALIHPWLDRQASAQSVLAKLELDVRMRLDGLLHGDYRGLVPGHGSEAGETRRYEPGDDVRRIDWNVTARMQDPHIRQTIADRELETSVAVDLSPSLDFGTAMSEKRDLALAATAAIGFLTARVGNRFGAELIGATSITSIPAKQGRNHLMSILSRVFDAPRESAGVTTSLAEGILRLGAGHRKRGLRVVISDFLAPPGWEAELRRLNTRHQTLAIEILDPRELELPNVGRIMMMDPESGRVREVNTSNRATRARFAEAAEQQRADNAASIQQAGAGHLVLRTDQDWLREIVRFVANEKQKSTAAAGPKR